jgi:hypothetical protein
LRSGESRNSFSAEVAVCWGFHYTAQIEVGLLQAGFLGSPRTESRSWGWTPDAFNVYVRTLAMKGMYDANALEFVGETDPKG